ncbi:glycine cleavage system protein H [Nocardia crassostreae]|uniref:glycine cleavage system protein H n=1 Tax=Nocardia crassostreae TaxID=53428 RepID=UPI000834C265|nr:glycine cleavage system protein GcvH [Nocardia crassostreae]
MSEVPADRRYTDSHEWVRTEADGTEAVGVTEHKFALDDVLVAVMMPDVGREVTVSELVGTIEAARDVNDIYAPASGTVIAINADLEDSPEGVSIDPYEAWIFKLRLAADASTDGLLDATEYVERMG